MGNENGEWIMRGLSWDDPYRIRTWEELVNWIDEVGFLPLFANEVTGFSVEEHVFAGHWWTGSAKEDPWEWREIIARSRKTAYGKFFDKKAGFISLKWLPFFANARRSGYDFDAKWADGLADRREKAIMDFYLSEEDSGDLLWKTDQILSTDLKKMAGFGKMGAKNYSGIVTRLQMELYLVTVDFCRRTNKRGEEYGMPVSVMLPPESVWGYDLLTSAYHESPEQSRQRIYDRVRELYPAADEKAAERILF